MLSPFARPAGPGQGESRGRAPQRPQSPQPINHGCTGGRAHSAAAAAAGAPARRSCDLLPCRPPARHRAAGYLRSGRQQGQEAVPGGRDCCAGRRAKEHQVCCCLHRHLAGAVLQPGDRPPLVVQAAQAGGEIHAGEGQPRAGQDSTCSGEHAFELTVGTLPVARKAAFATPSRGSNSNC